jgi:hypothetical protein
LETVDQRLSVATALQVRAALLVLLMEAATGSRRPALSPRTKRRRAAGLERDACRSSAAFVRRPKPTLLLLPRCSSATTFGSLLAALPLIVETSSLARVTGFAQIQQRAGRQPCP